MYIHFPQYCPSTQYNNNFIQKKRALSSKQRDMAQLNPSHIELFAKLSKILADTFGDIHQIFMKELGQGSGQGSEKGEIGPATSQNPQQNVSNSTSIGATMANFNDRHSTAKQQWLEKRSQEKAKQKDDLNDSKMGDNENQNQSSSHKPIKPKKSKPKPSEPNPNNEAPSTKEKRQEKKKKVAKWQQEGKPRPPLNAFMLFLKDSKVQIMDAKPELTPSQVSSYASALWNQLTEEEKEKYRREYRENRAKYDELLKQYNDKEKLNGKLLMKPKAKSEKGDKIEKPEKAEKPQKAVKDILDQQIMGDQLSSDSQSLSGI